MTTQICTTVEQSERLLAAGVSPETADMVYHHKNSRVPALEWELRCTPPVLRTTTKMNIDRLVSPLHKNIDGTPMTGEEVFDKIWGKDIPAWSLSKLIDMMPPFIEGRGSLYLCAGLHTKRYNADNRIKDHQYAVEFGVNYTSERYDTPFSALIDTIDWLIKEGLFDPK